MKVAMALLAVTTLGVGSTYLAQEPTATTLKPPVVIRMAEDVSPLEKARRATFMIMLPDYKVGGSATLVGRKKLENGNYSYNAVTAYHVVDDMAKAIAKNKLEASHKMELMFQPQFHGQPLRVKLEIEDIEWAIPSQDWASFRFESPHKLGCVEVATKEEFQAIKPFEKIYAVGCFGGFGQHCREGIVGATHNQWRDLSKQTKYKWPWAKTPDRFFRPAISVWYGDSGGAVYSKDGKLIGIINAFGVMGGQWEPHPVAHSMVAFKTHILRDLVEHSKDFFLVEE